MGAGPAMRALRAGWMIAGLVLLVSLQASALWGQVARDSTVVVVPGPQFGASGWHRFWMGDTYRDLWTTPIRVPVLDLATHGGGLQAFEKGGSKQSLSLRFRAGDGRLYVFKLLEKDPTQTWPELLRASPARNFADDQISGIYPAGAVAVAVLEQAAGLVNPGVSLYALPDDPRLGEWRDEFKGKVGILEQRFRGSGSSIRDVEGAAEVVTTDTLYQRLIRDGRHTVDQRRYLAARLFDVVVGDWDRHADQWSWARYDRPDSTHWVPIPRDRDWAMSRMDGPLYGLLRFYAPKHQSFKRGYGSIYGLTLSAEPLDRRLLGGLERAVWDSVVEDLRSRLDDATIERAVATLPAEFDRAATAWLSEALRIRRDQLPAAADRYYRMLAGTVDWWGTDESDRVEATATDAGVELELLAGSERTPRFTRRFLRTETDEIRLYLQRGVDSVIWRGVPSTGIKIRVIDPERPVAVGTSSLVVTDSTAGRLPTVPDHLEIQRDWGSLHGIAPWFETRPEVGLLIGGGPLIYKYGFRRVPYAARLAFRLAYSTGSPGFNADFNGDFRFEDPHRRVLLRAAFLRVDATRYFGTGNETVLDHRTPYYQVRQRLYLVEPTWQYALGSNLVGSIGAFLRSSETDLDDPSLLTLERPYGSGKFTEAGGKVGLALDTRNDVVFPTRGVRLEATASMVPAVFDAVETFGRLDAKAAGYYRLGIPTRPTLAVRVGASKDFGQTPFFEASSIGGRGSVRGFNTRRFLGDAAVYGSAEARFALGRFDIILPGEWGIYGLADVGRVYLDGEDSDQWHSAGGGGLWFAFLDKRSTITLTWAGAEERSRIYIQAGFHF